MKLFKEHSYDVVRLFINQIGIAIFSLMLYTAVGMMDDEALTTPVFLAISAFSMIFYAFLIYAVAWDLGAKDKIRVDAGRCEETPAKGFLIALLANLPNFLLSGVALLLCGLYLLGAGDGCYTVFGVLNLIFRFLESMYLGLISAIIAVDPVEPIDFFRQTIGYVLFPLYSVGVCGVGYLLGASGRKIFGGKINHN